MMKEYINTVLATVDLKPTHSVFDKIFEFQKPFRSMRIKKNLLESYD